MRPFILTALALGAFTTTAAAEPPLATPGPVASLVDQQTASRNRIELTDAELDRVTGGNNANSNPGYWHRHGAGNAQLFRA